MKYYDRAFKALEFSFKVDNNNQNLENDEIELTNLVTLFNMNLNIKKRRI